MYFDPEKWYGMSIDVFLRNNLLLILWGNDVHEDLNVVKMLLSESGKVFHIYIRLGKKSILYFQISKKNNAAGKT